MSGSGGAGGEVGLPLRPLSFSRSADPRTLRFGGAGERSLVGGLPQRTTRT